MKVGLYLIFGKYDFKNVLKGKYLVVLKKIKGKKRGFLVLSDTGWVFIFFFSNFCVNGESTMLYFDSPIG